MKPTPNKKQQECIDNIEGKYLVLAGPGTGKTFTIIERIKSMLQKGIEPSKILCLTFTEAAATEMKSRLEKDLTKLDTGVNIYTYHGFCNEIISQSPSEFELSENYKTITDTISRNFLKECIDEIHPVAYRTTKNDPYIYLNEIKRQIEEIKKNRLTKEQYFENIEKNPDWKPELHNLQQELKEKNEQGKKIPQRLLGGIDAITKKIAKAEELWKFFELYKAKMEAEHFLDFNDMISFVLEKFETEPAFLAQIANKYEYILVDEYQDTNKAQNEIVFYLTKALDSENIFVVGDDDQIIYTFQGAKLDTMEKFLEEFPETKVICLTENMRSTQQMLNAARKIIIQDDSRLENNPKFKQYNINKTLVAANPLFKSNLKQVRCSKFSDIMQEYNAIADEIDSLINSDNCLLENGEKNLSQIAILTKTNSELETFAELLKQRNIPSELKDGINIFKIKSVIAMYYYMQFLTNPEFHSDKLFRLFLLPPFNIHPKDYETIYNKRSENKSILEVLKSINKNELINFEAINDFLNIFDYLNKYKSNENLKNTVLEIGAKTGIFNYYINSEVNRNDNIAGLKKLVEEASNFTQIHKTINLEDFVEYLDIAYTEETPITTDKAPLALNAVQLSTYHSAKGREFEYVYMPTLLKYKWESDTSSLKSTIPLDISEYKTKDELDKMKRSDKIKLMYVGMTRAKHTLYISYPQTVNGSVKPPTEFITNIQDSLELQTAEEYDINSYLLEETKSLLKRSYDYKKDFYSMVDAKLNGKSFSPSAINTYLKCPRQYLYNNILGLDSKNAAPDNMSYGSAVHSACEFMAKYAKENNQYPSKQEFIDKFKAELSKLPISTYQQREILSGRGESKLDEFYPQLCSTPISMLYELEYPVKFEMDGIKFYGIIDRIDKNSDGTYTIYDYKTGSAKNEKTICPNGEYEAYYNQIGLYKHFFEKLTGSKVKETSFIFPEEFTENFTLNLTENDCIEIETKFKQAISDIKEYKFEPIKERKKDKAPCKYCQYKEFCEMEII